MVPSTVIITLTSSAVNERVAAVVFFASFIGLFLFMVGVLGLLNGAEGIAFIAIVLFGPLVIVSFLFGAVGWAISRPLAKWALPLLASRYEPTTTARILCVLLSVAVATIGVIAFVLSDPAKFGNVTSAFVLGAWPLLAASFGALFAWLLIKHIDQGGGA